MSSLRNCLKEAEVHICSVIAAQETNIKEYPSKKLVWWYNAGISGPKNYLDNFGHYV